MLTQNINPLKLALALHNSAGEGSRYSILDLIVLLLINEHPGSGKSDLCEILYGDRAATKSSLDRPVKRLVGADLIRAEYDQHASVKSGASRTTYYISKSGESFLKKCR